MLAERKEANGVATYNNELGVKLVTASNRRNSPQCLDSVIHHNNLLINILVGSTGTDWGRGGGGGILYSVVRYRCSIGTHLTRTFEASASIP